MGYQHGSNLPHRHLFWLDDELDASKDEAIQLKFTLLRDDNAPTPIADLMHQSNPAGPDNDDLPASDGQSYPSLRRTSQAELEALSSREYSLRVSDPNDFASVWESLLVPLLTKTLCRHCNSGFAVDVHTFPNQSSTTVPRVIFITTPKIPKPEMEAEISAELGAIIPSRFGPVYLKFQQGSVKKSKWWGGYENERDDVCEPQNITYREFPVIGMSIGPIRVRDAASLGGFIEVGSHVYALSAFHPFEDGIKLGHARVTHPAGPDHEMNQRQNPNAESYGIGSVAMHSPDGAMRPSLTFEGMDIPRDSAQVGMDWCAIGPVFNGKNIVSVPCFEMSKNVVVEKGTMVTGNTEAYALARTSGYSLGYTSDVPGLQKMWGRQRREWTVRQYSPLNNHHATSPNLRWQTTRQWVTGAMGAPGDSGAWLVRRSDNAVMGLIWGRNKNRGDPKTEIRLTYFTPIVDILADIQENHTNGESTNVLSNSSGTLSQFRREQELPIERWLTLVHHEWM